MLASLLSVLVLGFDTFFTRAQPLNGNWDVVGVEVVENDAIELSGNLTIRVGGSLTLRNVVLRMNLEGNGQYGISVEEGGSLYIYDCNISSATEFRFFFIVVGGKFVMKNSELRDAGWGGGGDWGGEPRKRGLYIQAEDAVIDGNFISDSLGVFLCLSQNSSISNNRLITDYGITVTHSVSPYQPIPQDNSILNNTIQGAQEYGITIGAGNSNVVANNTILDAMVGIYLAESRDNTIENNTVIPEHHPDPWGGIVLWNWCVNNTIKNNTIRKEVTSGIIDGIEVVRSVNNRIEGNTVENLRGGITLSYSHDNVVATNNLSDIWWGGPESGSAIQLYHSTNSTIINNQISGAQSNAILLCDMSRNNVIQANVINSSYNGISIHYSSDNNIIANNVISNIGSWTILLDESFENVVFDNDFFDPIVMGYDNGTNRWDYGGHGNYWGDYGGQDEDGNGIGDEPYHILPNGTDAFPLTSPKQVTSMPVPILEPASLPLSPPDSINAEITTKETWKNETVMINRITVKNGGNLTLQNMTIMISNGYTGISMEAGGSLYILDSNITAFDPNYGGYSFYVMHATEFVIKNSELHYAGFCFQGDFPGGLSVISTNATIENNVFTHNYRALCVTTHLHVTPEPPFCYITNNTVSYSYDGMSTNTCDVMNNTISKTIQSGIFGSTASQQWREFYIMAYNDISQVWMGALMLNQTDGIWVMDNKISQSEKGILLFSSAANCRIIGNVIRDTWGWTIQISNNEYASTSNIVANNTILDCGGGIYLAEDSYGNLIYRNTIINSPNSSDLGSNVWDYNGEGNYWSDYTGVDVKKGSNQDMPGSDGVGDTPYIIDVDSADRFPLMYPYGSPPPRTYSLTIATNTEGTTDPSSGEYNYTTYSTVQVTAIPNVGFAFNYWLLDGVTIQGSSINIIMDKNRTLSSFYIDASAPVADAGSDQTVNASEIVYFDAGGSSDNVGVVSFEWDFGDGQTGMGETVTHIYSSPGTYTVTLTVQDAAENAGSDTVTVTVQSEQGFPWTTGGILIILAVAIVAIYLLVIKKRL